MAFFLSFIRRALAVSDSRAPAPHENKSMNKINALGEPISQYRFTSGLQLFSPASEPKAQFQKDRPFNGFRTAATPNAKHAVAELTHLLKSYEAHRAPRKRARKPEDQATFERQIEALACDLIHSHLTRPGAWLSISLSNDNLGRFDRYRPQAITKTIKTVLKFMTSQEMEMAEHQLGFRSQFVETASRQSTIRAGARLIAVIDDYGLKLDDFSLHKSQEVIILKDSKEDIFDKGRWIQYTDTKDTIRYRHELRCINDTIQSAELDCSPTDHRPSRPFDTSDRCLRRIFNNYSFEQGGRLFGGFWQPLSKSQRRHITIDGLPTVTLDYGQMVPRILYGVAGHEPTFADAYTIPGLEGHREGVKKVLNSMLHRDEPLTQKMKGCAALLPKKMTINDITDRIMEFHKPVAHAFYAGKGLYLSFIESRILVEVLTKLADLGITALPIHDAIMVKAEEQTMATEVMLQVFREVTGIDGLVKVEV